jgi:hypothetical protein
MTADGVPPWGTPDDETPDESRGDDLPAYGTPPAAPVRYGQHNRRRGGPPAPGSPDPAAATASGWGTPGAEPDLLTADTVVVAERRGFLSKDGYELLTDDDVVLGSLIQEASTASIFFGGAATTTYRLLDRWGALVASMIRPGTLGRSRFVVTDAGDVEVGTVEQENSFGAPQFLLTPVYGRQLRLVGGRFGSREWQLTHAADDSLIVGVVSQQYSGLGGMINNVQRFAVQLAPELKGDHRLLAVMATICVDYVRDAKRKR